MLAASDFTSGAIVGGLVSLGVGVALDLFRRRADELRKRQSYVEDLVDEVEHLQLRVSSTVLAGRPSESDSVERYVYDQKQLHELARMLRRLEPRVDKTALLSDRSTRSRFREAYHRLADVVRRMDVLLDPATKSTVIGEAVYRDRMYRTKPSNAHPVAEHQKYEQVWQAKADASAKEIDSDLRALEVNLGDLLNRLLNLG